MGKKKNKNPPQKWESYAGDTRFVRVFESMFDSPAFISLTPVATRIYLIIKNQYKGNYTMNRVICPYSTIEKYGISRNSIPGALRLLEALGFITMESGHLMREPTIYHFSDKWKDVKDINAAKTIKKELKDKINREKDIRKELYHTYGDK